APVTIIDDDAPPPSISIGSAVATEPLFGTINAQFTVTLSEASPNPITVDFHTIDGSAIAGSDYTATSGTVSFAADQTSATIDVPVLSDFVQEDQKTFTVELSNASLGADITTADGIATIANQAVNTVTIDAAHPYRFIDSS